MEEKSQTCRLLEAMNRILVPVRGDFLEGAGVREGSWHLSGQLCSAAVRRLSPAERDLTTKC